MLRLGAEAQAQDCRLLHLTTVTSTMDEARSEARQLQPWPLWIVADKQQGGRGRHGREWVSPPGNLYTSLLLPQPCAPAQAAQLGFVASLALHDTVSGLTGLHWPQLSLKWPNDLLVTGAKLAGLLLEGIGGPDGRFSVTIGIGVNLASAPADTPYPATALNEHVPPLARDDLFAALSDAMMSRLNQWDGGKGFAGLREAWLQRSTGVGTTVTLRLPDGPLSGRFTGLDAGGRLELLTAQGLRTIDAGDLFFGADPGAQTDQKMT